MQAPPATPCPAWFPPAWWPVVGDHLQTPEMAALREFLARRRREAEVYPPAPLVFNALAHTPFERVKVVILGQDPYHGPGQAHGLCFSVLRGVPPPPSLVNIFKELQDDLPDFTPPGHGELTAWADEGVLLLNSVLTVERGNAGAHKDRGWEGFTDRVVAALSARPEPLVFLLWGSPAQRKGAHVDRRRHLVLEAPHPSPLSAYRGFFGCRHFSKANAFLAERGQTPIQWNLPA